MEVEDEFLEVVVRLDEDLSVRLLAAAKRLGMSPSAVIKLSVSQELPGLEAEEAPKAPASGTATPGTEDSGSAASS